MGIADLIRNRFEWRPDTTLLDFGCGCHGSIAAELCDLAARTVAVDVSPKVVAEFNRRCANQGLTADEVVAIESNHLWNSPQFQKYFDVVVASLVWHHIEAPDRADTAYRLARCLKEGGVLLIVDLRAAPGINGVTNDELDACLRFAGLATKAIETGPRITLRSGRKTRLLIAQGIRT